MTSPDDPAQVIALWHGAGAQQLLHATGWVGEHPEDGSDVAHLLLYPHGHGAGEQMRALAYALDLAPASSSDPIPQVPAETASAWIDPDSWVHLGAHARELLRRPVDGMWWAAATAHHFIALSIGMDPLHWREGDWPTLDRYLDRRDRYHLGLIHLTA